MRQRFATTIGIVIAAAVAFLILATSKRFNDCIDKAYENGTQQSLPQQITNFFVVRKRCAGDVVELYSNGIIALFTVILAGSTLGLWSTTRKGIQTQISDTRILQRAYLNVLPAGIEPYRSLDGRLSCDVYFENSGNLPASNVRWAIEQEFCTDPRRNNFPIDESKIDGNNLIPPHGKIRKGAPAINSAELDAFRKRQQGIPDSCWLYVWGRVRYLDGFNQRRFIDFCYRYYLAGTTWTISHRHGRQHEHGNRTDEG